MKTARRSAIFKLISDKWEPFGMFETAAEHDERTEERRQFGKRMFKECFSDQFQIVFVRSHPLRFTAGENKACK